MSFTEFPEFGADDSAEAARLSNAGEPDAREHLALAGRIGMRKEKRTRKNRGAAFDGPPLEKPRAAPQTKTVQEAEPHQRA